jgi:hemerythrin-like metal-binding protein
MAIFILEDRVRTGVPKIDQAHEQLLAGLEKLVDAVRRDVAHKHVVEYLDLMGYLVTEHFQDEEAAMRRTGYPLILAHLIQHQQMAATFNKLADEYRVEGDNKPLIVRMGNFMSAWMADHMYRYDLHMAQWFQNPANSVAANQLRVEA